MRSLQKPIVDRLDPSQSFNAQLRRATKMMDDDDAATFKNCQESLLKAKKEKLNFVRDAQKAMAAKLQQEEAEANAAKGKKGATATQWIATSNTQNLATFGGKLKILKDVKQQLYPMPKNFPTVADLGEKVKE